MKKLLLCILGLVCACNAFAESTNEWIHFRDTLAGLNEYMQKWYVQTPADAVDRMVGPLPRQPAFQDLQKMMKTSWPVALEHFDQIATNDVKKMVLLLSSWELPEDEFTEFLTQVADMVEAGKLDWQLLKWTSSPFNSGRENYDLKKDKHIKAVIQRVRELKPSAQP